MVMDARFYSEKETHGNADEQRKLELFVPHHFTVDENGDFFTTVDKSKSKLLIIQDRKEVFCVAERVCQTRMTCKIPLTHFCSYFPFYFHVSSKHSSRMLLLQTY